MRSGCGLWRAHSGAPSREEPVQHGEAATAQPQSGHHGDAGSSVRTGVWNPWPAVTSNMVRAGARVHLIYI